MKGRKRKRNDERRSNLKNEEKKKINYERITERRSYVCCTQEIKGTCPQTTKIKNERIKLA